MVDSLVYVVDDDADLAASLVRMLHRNGYRAEPFSNPSLLIECYAAEPAACVITDVMMDYVDGFSFASRLRDLDPSSSIIFVTAWPRSRDAVDAIRALGGIDYLDKPIDEQRLLASVAEGVRRSSLRAATSARLSSLSARELQVFELLVRGHSTKAIAAKLSISSRTVDDHRSNISMKTGTNSIAQLIEINRTLS